MAGNRILKIEILGDASSAQKAMGGLDQTTTKTTGTLKKVGAIATSAFGALGAASFLKSATHAAAEEGQEIGVLANTLRKATGASKEQIDSTEKWITKMQNATGIMDDQLRPAMGKLVISGRSVKQAEQDLGVAADIAAARHKDLASVVQAMSKAALGNVAGLGRLGIATKNAAGETLSYDEILQNASKTMGGAAAAAADTAAGRAAILHAKFEDLRENIGAALIPVMETLVGVLSKLSGWFNNQSPAVQKMVIAGAALLVTLGPLVALITNVASAVKGLGIAMDFVAANPVVLIIAALVAAGIALVVLYQKSETFRGIVNGVFHAVAAAAKFMADIFGKAFDFIKQHLDLILVVGLGPLGVAIALLRHNWKTAWNAIQDVIEAVWKVIRPILHAIKQAIDDVIGPLGKVVGFAGKVGGGIGKVVGHIPGFAEGGMVPGAAGAPMLAVVHGGERVLTPTQQFGATSSGVVIHLNGHVMAKESWTRELADEMAWRLRRRG